MIFVFILKKNEERVHAISILFYYDLDNDHLYRNASMK